MTNDEWGTKAADQCGMPRRCLFVIRHSSFPPVLLLPPQDHRLQRQARRDILVEPAQGVARGGRRLAQPGEAEARRQRAQLVRVVNIQDKLIAATLDQQQVAPEAEPVV